jgi:hypothetical protein
MFGRLQIPWSNSRPFWLISKKTTTKGVALCAIAEVRWRFRGTHVRDRRYTDGFVTAEQSGSGADITCI